MTIKIKVSDLQNSIPALRALSELKTSFKISYDIAKRLKVIEAELKEIDARRIKIAKELSGDKLKEDGTFDLGDKMPEFSRQYQEILDTEIELDITPLNTKIFEAEAIKISSGDLSSLFFLFEELKNDN